MDELQSSNDDVWWASSAEDRYESFSWKKTRRTFFFFWKPIIILKLHNVCLSYTAVHCTFVRVNSNAIWIARSGDDEQQQQYHDWLIVWLSILYSIIQQHHHLKYDWLIVDWRNCLKIETTVPLTNTTTVLLLGYYFIIILLLLLLLLLKVYMFDLLYEYTSVWSVCDFPNIYLIWQFCVFSLFSFYVYLCALCTCTVQWSMSPTSILLTRKS